MAKLFPALPLRGPVQFPGTITSMTVPRGPSVQALDAHLDQRLDLILVLQKDFGLENPGPDDVHPVGVSCRVLRTLGLPDGAVRALVEVLDRVHVKDFAEHATFGWACTPSRFAVQPGPPQVVQAAEKRVRELASE